MLLVCVLPVVILVLVSIALVLFYNRNLSIKKIKKLRLVASILPIIGFIIFLILSNFVLKHKKEVPGKVEEFSTIKLHQVDSFYNHELYDGIFVLSYKGRALKEVTERDMVKIITTWRQRLTWDGNPSTCVTVAEVFKKEEFVPDSIFDYKIEHKHRLYERESTSFVSGQEPIRYLQSEFEYFVSRKSTNLLPKILVYYAGEKGGLGSEIVKEQRAYIRGGFDNEVFFCVGIDDNREIVWSDSFSKHRKRSKFEDTVIKSSLKPDTKFDEVEVFNSIVDNYNLWKSPKEVKQEDQYIEANRFFLAGIMMFVLSVGVSIATWQSTSVVIKMICNNENKLD